MVQLFHKDVGLPSSVVGPPKGMTLHYSRHAQRQATLKDVTWLPSRLPDYALIEAELMDGQETKWVVRLSFSPHYDLVLVLLSSATVKTVWLNAKTDTHRTLNRGAYTNPRNFNNGTNQST